MELLDLIYHQFFFTSNSLGRQPMIFQSFQPLTPQTIALAVAAIHCVLSEYAVGKKAPDMISQDEDRDKFCSSRVMKFTPEATALINHIVADCFITTAVQLCKDRCSAIRIGVS